MSLLKHTAEPVPLALPPLEVCRQARLSRDARFEGRFFVAVLTTGIFCRPTCPARMPAESNVRYYASAGSALEAGYRPCLRCRPEAAPGQPEWTLGSETVMRGLRLIDAGYLNDHSLSELAARLGIGDRQLSRLFAAQLGASPASIAALVRANLARKLLRGSALPHSQVAFHAGYRSVSRFNHEIRRIFQCTPGALRKARSVSAQGSMVLQLPVRAPYDFDWVFGYLQARALAGLEGVEGGPGSWVYRRRLHATTTRGEPEVGQAGWLEVRQVRDGLELRIPFDSEPLHQLLQRVHRVFDLSADGATVHDFLLRNSALSKWVSLAPGLRVPGAWDGFETAVRAVLGQQVSVARGTALADAMVARYGQGMFPAPEEIMHREVAELGMPGRRGRAIAELARRVHCGELTLDEGQSFETLHQALMDIDGIGPWTANYIRMRVARDPDAFPDNDWVVLKQLDCSATEARKRAEAWRPWRAYALMYLWYAAGHMRAEKNRSL